MPEPLLASIEMIGEQTASSNSPRYPTNVIYTVLPMTLLLALLAPVSSDDADCPRECQLEQVNTYFRALDEVYREESTVAEIDALLSVLHDEVRYVHVANEADFDRDAWRAAFVANLERGAYANEPAQRMQVLDVIYGRNHAAVAYAPGVVQPDGTWEGREPLLVLFEFRDGKIVRIEELR